MILSSNRKPLSGTTLQVLKALAEYHVLSTSRIYGVLGLTRGTGKDDTKTSNIRQILGTWGKERMTRDSFGRITGYPVLIHAEDIRRPERSKRGQAVNENAYYLTPSGLQVVRHHDLDPDMAAIGQARRSVDDLEHDLEMSDLHIALNKALEADGQEHVWWRQHSLLDQFGKDKNGFNQSVNPDALLFHGNHYFFLEYERSRAGHYRPDGAGKNQSQLLQKFGKYQAYYETKAFKTRWPEMADFYMLTVVQNQVRRDNLIYGPVDPKTGARIREKSLLARYPRARFLVTTRPEFLAEPLNAPLMAANGKTITLRSLA